MHTHFLNTLLTYSYTKKNNYSFIFIAKRFLSCLDIKGSQQSLTISVSGQDTYYVCIFYKKRLLTMFLVSGNLVFDITKLNFDVYMLGYIRTISSTKYLRNFIIDIQEEHFINFQHLQLPYILFKTATNSNLQLPIQLDILKLRKTGGSSE